MGGRGDVVAGFDAFPIDGRVAGEHADFAVRREFAVEVADGGDEAVMGFGGGAAGSADDVLPNRFQLIDGDVGLTALSPLQY